MSGQPAPIRPRERFLARVIVVQLVVGIGAAVLPAAAEPVTAAIRSLAPGESSEDVVPSPRVAVPSTASSTTAPPPEPAAPSEVETVVVTEPPATSPATTTTISPTTTTTVVPGSVPPAAGTYPYRLWYEEENRKRQEANGRMVVEDAHEAEGETRQTYVYTDEVYGTYSEHYAWRGDGIFLRSMDDSSGAEGNSCDFEPDVLAYPLPLEEGRKWKVDSACANDADAERYKASSAVQRTDRITVGGRKVDVFVVWTNRLTNEGRGFVHIMDWAYFAPSVGLTVKGNTNYRYTEDGSSSYSWSEGFELTTLEPQ